MNISAEKLPNFTKQTVHYVKSKLAEVCIFAVTLCSSSFWGFFLKKSGGEWNYWLHKEHNTCFVMKEAMIYTLFRRIWSNTGYYWSLCRVFLVGLVLSSDMCLVACCLQNVLKMCCHIFFNHFFLYQWCGFFPSLMLNYLWFDWSVTISTFYDVILLT